MHVTHYRILTRRSSKWPCLVILRTTAWYTFHCSTAQQTLKAAKEDSRKVYRRNPEVRTQKRPYIHVSKTGRDR